MAKMLVISPEKCTGCRSCELACVFNKEQQFTPSKARVSVMTWEKAGVSVPIMCFQCDSAACMKVCPMGAISRNNETGAMIVNHTKCIACKMCTNACPFGNIVYDGDSRTILKCDLCGGNPECAKICPSGAITYQESSTANVQKKKAFASKFKALFEEANS